MRCRRREHTVVLHPVCARARHESAESLDELEVGQGDVRSAVAVRGLELQPDVLAIESLEPLVGDRGTRQVATEPLEAVRIASTNRHIGVKVEPVGTRAARARPPSSAELPSRPSTRWPQPSRSSAWASPKKSAQPWPSYAAILQLTSTTSTFQWTTAERAASNTSSPGTHEPRTKHKVIWQHSPKPERYLSRAGPRCYSIIPIDFQ